MHFKIIKIIDIYFIIIKIFFKRIPRNQRATAYCYGIKYGDKSDWEFLWHQYKSTNSATEETLMLNAFGCSDDPEIIEK